MLRRLLQAFQENSSYVWRVFYWLLLPTIIVIGGRGWIASTIKKDNWKQFGLILIGEVQFLVSFSSICILLLVLTAPRTKLNGILRWVFGVSFFVFAFVSLFDIGYFDKTGDRLDLDSFLVFYSEFSTIWPVVQSELSIAHMLAFLGLLIPFFLSMLLPVPSKRIHPVLLLGYVALLPILHGVYLATPLPKSNLRGLERSLVSLLGEEIVIAYKERSIPPQPDELIPISVASTKEQPPNVIVVFLESTGKMHTSLGTDKDVTPNLAKLAKEGWVVDDANAVVPHTTKALISTICGDWPQLVTAVPEASFGGLPEHCLPTLLKSIGYRTAFVQTARHTFEERRDLVHFMGFDYFRSKESLNRRKFESSNYFGLDDRAMIEPAIRWLKKGKEPFFLSMLTLASHHKYTLPKKEKPKFTKKGTKYKHLSAVHYVDTVLGEFIERLTEEDLLSDTLLIIVGDHGEGMGEHGRKQHDLVLWQEGISIPMVLYGPDVLEGTGIIKGPRQQIDVLPTVLDLIGAKVTTGSTRGVSLFSEVPEDRNLYISCWRERRCLSKREGMIKFIEHYGRRTWEKYDLRTDQKEKTNLANDTDTKALSSMRDELLIWKRKVRGLYEARFEKWKKESFTEKTDVDPIVQWQGISLLGCALQDKIVYKDASPWLKCRWRVDEKVEDWRTIVLELRYRKTKKRQQWEPTKGAFPMYRWPVGTEFEEHIPIKLPRGKRGSVSLWIGLGDSNGDPISPLQNDGDESYYELFSFRIR